MLSNIFIKNLLQMKKILTFLLFCLSFQFLNGQSFNGFALYNGQGSNTTYLIDENENIAHTWSMNTECNYAVQLKNNGNLVRGTKYNQNILGGAAEGGRVQEIDPLGNIVWDYIYSSSNHLSHHDLTLIGDNVLLTAWEVKSAAELTAAGYTGNIGSAGKWPTHFIELEPDGNGGANIVWEWHIWDHLCQDTDPNKPNYVNNISDHPERIDINMIQGGGGGGPGGGGGDWFHVNGVDYNEDLDQIAFSSRFSSEIYIIDHSTTTLEATSSSGGNSGMGGDILYRWGNPSNYGMSGTQVIASAVHDVRWITDDGRPNGGFLQIFNNKGISNNQSTIDGIETPLDPATGYTYLRNPGQAFEPINYTTRYECLYSAPGQSASDRMSNGNIYVNASGGQGGAGVMYEVDSLGNIVWGPYQAGSQKGFRYECNYPGIIALQSYINTNTTSCFISWDCDGQGNCIDPGTGNGQYSSLSDCNNECISTSVVDHVNHIFVYPNPVNKYLNINSEGLKEVYDIFGSKVISSDKNKIDIGHLSNGVYSLRIAEIHVKFIKR